MNFVLIPAGTFTMGSDAPEDNLQWSAQPTRTVTLPTAFYMAQSPCTHVQWKAVMNASPSLFTLYSFGPVERVSWDMIRAAGTGFLDQLNAALPGYGFRLPSEAEYEYATRAGTTTAYFFGSDSTNLSTFAVWYGNSAGSPKQVGSFAPNPWGLFDIVGNVWAWCEDDSHTGYTSAPSNGGAWVDNPRAPFRIRRGGSWANWAWGGKEYRSAFRDQNAPNDISASVGCRLVLPVPPTH
jgi:formylglycine-generating enzyme required for sulfatase activity